MRGENKWERWEIMIDKIEIRDFKGIKSLDIENLKKINFFIGGNNCYKTSILEAIALSNIKNIREIIGNTKYNIPQELLDSLFYNLNFENTPTIKLTAGKKEIKTILKHKNTQEVIALNSDNEEIDVETTKNYFLSVKGNFKNEFIDEKIDIIEENNRLKIQHTGKNILNYIYIPSTRKSGDFVENIRKIQQNKGIEQIVAILKNYDENVESIYADGTKVFINLLGYGKSLPIDSMGDGLISACMIASNILLNDSATILIDEIENGLYKDNILRLIKFILETTQDKEIQLFITTHSEEFLKDFYSVVNSEDDISKIYRVEKKLKEIEIVTYSNSEAKEALLEGWEVR